MYVNILYIYTHTHTHTHTYIYIYIYISQFFYSCLIQNILLMSLGQNSQTLFHTGIFRHLAIAYKLNRFCQLSSNQFLLSFEVNKFEVSFYFTKLPFNSHPNFFHSFNIVYMVLPNVSALGRLGHHRYKVATHSTMQLFGDHLKGVTHEAWYDHVSCLPMVQPDCQ